MPQAHGIGKDPLPTRVCRQILCKPVELSTPPKVCHINPNAAIGEIPVFRSGAPERKGVADQYRGLSTPQDRKPSCSGRDATVWVVQVGVQVNVSTKPRSDVSI